MKFKHLLSLGAMLSCGLVAQAQVPVFHESFEAAQTKQPTDVGYYEEINKEELEASMEGIYSESVNDFTRDESPMVYKPAEEIIANIGETVSIDTIIRPIFNFKASK